MTFSSIILSAAKAAKVSGPLLLAICTHESGLKNVIAYNDGNSHSYGICMVKYETAKMVGFKGKAKDLMNPTINATWAAKYVRHQANRYGEENWCQIVAAYNAGSYNASKTMPGKPRNLRYVKLVKSKLVRYLQPKLYCGVEIARNP